MKLPVISNVAVIIVSKVDVLCTIITVGKLVQVVTCVCCVGAIQIRSCSVSKSIIVVSILCYR